MTHRRRTVVCIEENERARERELCILCVNRAIRAIYGEWCTKMYRVVMKRGGPVAVAPPICQYDTKA